MKTLGLGNRIKTYYAPVKEAFGRAKAVRKAGGSFNAAAYAATNSLPTLEKTFTWIKGIALVALPIAGSASASLAGEDHVTGLFINLSWISLLANAFARHSQHTALCSSMTAWSTMDGPLPPAASSKYKLRDFYSLVPWYTLVLPKQPSLSDTGQGPFQMTEATQPSTTRSEWKSVVHFTLFLYLPGYETLCRMMAARNRG